MSNYFENSEWKLQRLGRFTASEMHKLMTSGRKKGETFGQTALTYIQEKIAEILTGECKELEGIKALEWGAANEMDAIREFAQIHHETVEFFGTGNPQFFAHDAVSGGSPDGLTETLVVECKCPYNSANHIDFLTASRALPKHAHGDWLKENWKEYYVQTQFNMLCCQRKKAVLISYDPRVINHDHRLAVLWIDANPDYQMDISNRILDAKKIVKRALNAFDGIEDEPLTPAQQAFEPNMTLNA